MGCWGRATRTVRLISAQATKEGTRRAKAKVQLTAYCPNKYNVKITLQLLDFF